MKNINRDIDLKMWKLFVNQINPVELDIDSKYYQKVYSHIFLPLISNIWRNFQNVLELKK